MENTTKHYGIRVQFKAKIHAPDGIIHNAPFIRIPKFNGTHVRDRGYLGQLAPAVVDRALGIRDARILSLPHPLVHCIKGGLISTFEISI